MAIERQSKGRSSAVAPAIQSQITMEMDVLKPPVTGTTVAGIEGAPGSGAASPEDCVEGGSAAAGFSANWATGLDVEIEENP